MAVGQLISKESLSEVDQYYTRDNLELQVT